MIEQNDFTEQVTTLLPVPVLTPVVSGYMQAGYDMKLAALLAQLLGITPEQLIARCQDCTYPRCGHDAPNQCGPQR